jgi:hypothetical protein
VHATFTIAKENLLEGATTVQSYQCRLERLDDAIGGPVGFIKIDIEAHELPVLEGAAEILNRDRPVLLIESEKRHHSEASENFLLSWQDTTMLVSFGKQKIMIRVCFRS